MGGPGQYNGGVVGVPTSQYGAGGSQYNAVPAYNQPAQAVAPMQPVAPMQSFQPPKDIPAPSGSGNPLMKRGRALDPSINSGQPPSYNNFSQNQNFGGQGYQQPYYPGGAPAPETNTYQPPAAPLGAFAAPAPIFQPANPQGDAQPNILTPDPMQGRVRTNSTAGGAALP